MKKLLVLLLFFTPFGLFAQESVTQSEDGKGLIVQLKKHIAFFDADSVRISTEMFNDSLATLKYFMSSRNVEDNFKWENIHLIPDCSYEEKYPLFKKIQIAPFSVIVDRDLVIKDVFVAEGMRRMLTVLDSLDKESE